MKIEQTMNNILGVAKNLTTTKNKYLLKNLKQICDITKDILIIGNNLSIYFFAHYHDRS